MKKNVFLLCTLLAVTLLIFTGCKKDDNRSFTGCRLTATGSGGALTSIFYDAQGRVLRTESGRFVFSYSYSGNTVTVLYTDANAFGMKTIYTLNNAGLTISARTEYDSLGNQWANAVFEYNGTELKKETRTHSSQSTVITNFTWLNGNIHQAEANGIIATYEYYENEPFKIGDYYFTNPINGPGHIIRNTNLIKSVTNNNPGSTPTLVTYIFDDDRKIISRTITAAGPPITNTFHYECN